MTTKQDSILSALLLGKRITALSGAIAYNTTAAQQRINEMRRAGCPIEDEFVSNGKSRFKVYFIPLRLRAKAAKWYKSQMPRNRAPC